jgi:hypothetical protein
MPDRAFIGAVLNEYGAHYLLSAAKHAEHLP